MQARALPPLGNGPVSPDTLPLGWEAAAHSSGAAPGLSAAGPARVATAADGAGENPWTARHAWRQWEQCCWGYTGIFSLGMHVVGAPFQKREDAVTDLMPLC